MLGLVNELLPSAMSLVMVPRQLLCQRSLYTLSEHAMFARSRCMLPAHVPGGSCTNMLPSRALYRSSP